MADPNLLPPTPTPTPTIVVDELPTSGGVRCGFCKAEITRAKGEIITMGARANALRDFEDDLGDANRDIAELKVQIEERDALIRTYEATIADLSAKLKKATSSFWR